MAAETLSTEKSVADSYRISVKELAAVRQGRLRREYHWVLDNSTVCYTPEGLMELANWVRPMPRPEAPHHEHLAQRFGFPALPLSDLDPAETVLMVTFIPPNPRMVIAAFPDGRKAKIFVKTNTKFKRGMQIPLGCLSRDKAPHGMSYRLASRLPRFYGRW